ncbi:molybdopterin-synthase adenylyltransferase MoeB [Gilliamella sp. wkB108]|uniref:molybdopterin-synthase adenylyltransferase MoeB n=1 Tax=Gilliamella sp. wkB108 TaxID=3120256 RepID=UPI00080ECCB9|nr:molybdopterin-synthase adenylyltransferase MoeB [Gilliamella apicola]OCG21629.1 molybdopterin-synthase adenylyltransferase MoeB [Gilliamella apicola]
MQELTDQELFRYDRQITLRGFDIDKQQILKNSSALIVGLGGLGCAASLYLTAAGIGKLTLLDFDTVSKSNLNRQILYSEKSINHYKVEQAKQALININANIAIETVNQQLDDVSLLSLIEQHDIVIDCTDNLTTREQINRGCFTAKKPLVSGAAIRMEGLLTVFTYQKDEACYHCLSRLFGQDQLTCVEAGVMSPLVGMFGSMQALEAIKVLTDYGVPLVGRLLMIDAMSMQFNQVSIVKQANCPVCGSHHLDKAN